MAIIDEKYKRLLKHIIDNGYDYTDPNRKKQNVVRKEIQSCQLQHKFKDGFPLLTTKQVYWKGIVAELLWILRGDTNIKFLVDNNVNIWNKDAYNWYKKYFNIYHPQSSQNLFTYEEFVERIKEKDDLNNFQNTKITLGDTGKSYGYQIRNWEGKFDQLKWLINELNTSPMRTKKTVTMWNPREANECALTPCHWSFEILVRPLSPVERVNIAQEEGKWTNIIPEGKTLSEVQKDFKRHAFTLKWHQHSVDTFLGLPFNIGFYSLLAYVIGKMTNMVPEGIIGDLSNVHLYYSHIPKALEQLKRGTSTFKPGTLIIPEKKDDIDAYLKSSISDFKIKNYKSYPAIPAKMLAYDN